MVVWNCGESVVRFVGFEQLGCAFWVVLWRRVRGLWRWFGGLMVYSDD
jgi:hypothetical protein